MEPIYIIAIVVGGLMLVLLCACVYVMARNRRREEEALAEQDAVYSDPKLAKMEYDIAFYDEETAAKLSSSVADSENGVPSDGQTEAAAEKSAPAERTAEEEAIFTKPDEGVEEISGHYEPEKSEE